MKSGLSGNIILILCISLLVACGNDDVSVDCPDGEMGENWVWTGKVCSLRRDGFNWSVSSIAPALDGSDDLYAVGSFTHFEKRTVKHIARLNNDGSLDRGFESGKGFSYPPNTIASANDGSGDIYVGGIFSSYNNSLVGGIARLNPDGSLDMGFDTGTGFLDTKTGYVRGVDIVTPAIDGSGDVYVGGRLNNYNGTTFVNWPIRLNSDGSLDADFNSDFKWGIQKMALAIDGSSDIYVVNKFGSSGVVRLNNDGSIDTGFDTGFDFDTGLSGFDGNIWAIALATDGSGDIFAAGTFKNYKGTATNGLARLNNDGSIDTSFVIDAKFFSWVTKIAPAIDDSGDVYVYANDVDIVRLNADGIIDTGFDTGPNGFSLSHVSISAIVPVLDGSGNIYIGGDITNFNSTSVSNLVRLTSEGALVK